MANLTEKYIRINMETTKQTPSECRYYKNGYCYVQKILTAFDMGYKHPCEIVKNPEVYCLSYKPKKKLYGK